MWRGIYMVATASKLSGALWGRGGKRKESLQLRLWTLNSISNSPVAPSWLSCQIFANQREAETNAIVNKHWKTRAKGNGVITNVIRISHRLIFIFQRRSCKLSFLFPPSRQSALESFLVGYLHGGRESYHEGWKIDSVGGILLSEWSLY